MVVRETSLSDPQVRELLSQHHRAMVAQSPPGFSFALDLTGLDSPAIRLFGAWEGAQLIAIGAVKRLSPAHVEIKSMRTHSDHLGKGAGQAVLARLIEQARADGAARISLETGRTEAYHPAIRLYERNGFVAGRAFADYENGPHNQCYHLDLRWKPSLHLQDHRVDR